MTSCSWCKRTASSDKALTSCFEIPVKPGQIYAKPVKASAGWGIYRLDAVKALEPISYAQYKEQ